MAACGEQEKNTSEPYYAPVTPPRKQEFRWANGKAPKSLDPARASVPPETDVVRAVFEGLTELDPTTLEPMPGVAESWTTSEDFRVWTFHLRADARWSNGKAVTSEDFVRSWKRLGQLGEVVANRDLLTNIVGFPIKHRRPEQPLTDLLPDRRSALPEPLPSGSASTQPPTADANSNTATAPQGPAPASFGVSAIDAKTLQVALIAPDKEFPKLVANPIFRPIYGDGAEFATTPLGEDIATNGAFRLVESGPDGVTLERSETYWNRENVKLERVRFISPENAEQALDAYRAGEIDAITNVDFEPLALKLLEPFADFRRRTHAAVNFYEINHERPPFDDRRVREALAIAIERERLTEGEMEGLTRPALSFLPFASSANAKIVQDKDRAADLLEEAGFPGGQNFPMIRLVVNRNDTQLRVARAVARMWKQNLNIDTALIVKENAQLEEARNAGDYDLVRRGAVFPSADELMSILAIFRPPKPEALPQATPSGSPEVGVEAEDPRAPQDSDTSRSTLDSPDVTMSEGNAVYELWAIPLYFPTSYSLVKPYVSGFEMNSLDAPLLHNVSIDSDWQPK